MWTWKFESQNQDKNAMNFFTWNNLFLFSVAPTFFIALYYQFNLHGNRAPQGRSVYALHSAKTEA